MISTAEKTSKPTTSVNTHNTQGTFFIQVQNETQHEPDTFFTSTVQSKIQISHTDDPQEKEAEAMAEKVMRQTDAGTQAFLPDKEKIQRKEKNEDEKLQLKVERNVVYRTQEKEENVLAKTFPTVQRMEMSSSLTEESDESLSLQAKQY